MRHYGTRTYEHQCDFDDKHRFREMAGQAGTSVKNLRQTLTDIVEHFQGNASIQDDIVRIVEKNGHDKHLINRLNRKIK